MPFRRRYIAATLKLKNKLPKIFSIINWDKKNSFHKLLAHSTRVSLKKVTKIIYIYTLIEMRHRGKLQLIPSIQRAAQRQQWKKKKPLPLLH